MDPRRLRELLERVKAGELDLPDAEAALRRLPFERLDDMAVVDHHRPLRAGVPEVVYGETKSADEIARIMRSLVAAGGGALATRVEASKAAEVLALVPGARYHEVGRVVVVEGERGEGKAERGKIAVAAAGTSDRGVAEEAALTAEFLGHAVDRVYDVGVAGMHRLVAHVDRLRTCEVVIVVAGMEGALPSVVAGLVDRPVIAVPTSVGYGVGLGGFVAMMGMLMSCAPGVTVCNIDNGFGAAVAASLMARRRA